MLLWILFFLFLSFVFFFFYLTGKKRFYILGCIILLVFSAIRFDVGWDYPMYFTLAGGKNYEAYAMLDFHYERMGFAIEKLLDFSNYMHNPYVFFIITSSIIVLCLAYAFFKISPRPELSLLCCFAYPHFFLDSYSTIRQWCAIAICFVALTFLFDKRKVWYVVSVLTASLFHPSAFIFFLINLIPHKLFSRKMYVGIIIAVMSYKYILIDYMLGFGGKFAYYISNKVGDGGAKISLMFLFFFIALFMIRKKVKSENFSYFLNIIFVGVLMSIIFSGLGHIAFRLPIYMMMFVCFAVPLFYSVVKNKIGFYWIFCLSHILMLVINLVVNDTPIKNPYVPYKTVFEAFQ